MSRSGNSGPATTERVRLEFDDGSGIDFATSADALFHVAYGDPNAGGGLRGVVRLVAVTHADADAMVVENKPVLNHTAPEIGAVVWDRTKIEQLVAELAAHSDTPGIGDNAAATVDTVAAVTSIAKGA